MTLIANFPNNLNNSSLTKKFTQTRGIPKGCPLAPLIYICISQLITDKCIDCFKIPVTPEEVEDIGILCFADDMSVLNTDIKPHNSRLVQTNIPQD